MPSFIVFPGFILLRLFLIDGNWAVSNLGVANLAAKVCRSGQPAGNTE